MFLGGGRKPEYPEYPENMQTPHRKAPAGIGACCEATVLTTTPRAALPDFMKAELYLFPVKSGNYPSHLSLSLQKRYDPARHRLVVCGHGTLAGDGVFCILSDDYGETWYNGAALKSIPYNQNKKSQDFNPDECQVRLLPLDVTLHCRGDLSWQCQKLLAKRKA